MAVFLFGALLGALIWMMHLPRWLQEILGWIVTTITVGTMWALRAKSERQSSDIATKGEADASR